MLESRNFSSPLSSIQLKISNVLQSYALQFRAKAFSQSLILKLVSSVNLTIRILSAPSDLALKINLNGKKSQLYDNKSKIIRSVSALRSFSSQEKFSVLEHFCAPCMYSCVFMQPYSTSLPCRNFCNIPVHGSHSNFSCIFPVMIDVSRRRQIFSKIFGFPSSVQVFPSTLSLGIYETKDFFSTYSFRFVDMEQNTGEVF